jgi:hypothetical protein
MSITEILVVVSEQGKKPPTPVKTAFRGGTQQNNMHQTQKCNPILQQR